MKQNAKSGGKKQKITEKTFKISKTVFAQFEECSDFLEMGFGVLVTYNKVSFK